MASQLSDLPSHAWLGVPSLGVSWAGIDPAPMWLDCARDFTESAVTVHLDAETAWRLCTRGIQPDDALARARVDSRHDLAEAACRIVSIIY